MKNEFMASPIYIQTELQPLATGQVRVLNLGLLKFY